jgi:hypothetical protein
MRTTALAILGLTILVAALLDSLNGPPAAGGGGIAYSASGSGA